jgi:hypothetical protein
MTMADTEVQPRIECKTADMPIAGFTVTAEDDGGGLQDVLAELWMGNEPRVSGLSRGQESLQTHSLRREDGQVHPGHVE